MIGFDVVIHETARGVDGRRRLDLGALSAIEAGNFEAG
jgi:hypothetical protein